MTSSTGYAGLCALVTALALSGCKAASPISHDDATLPLYTDARARLRCDLPGPDAEAYLSTLGAIERALDATFPWLPPAEAAPLTLALADGARFALFAADHRAEASSGAFLCSAGEVIVRAQAETLGPAADDLTPLEAPVRPLASASLRRRLLARGPLAPTWVEEGLASVFVEVVAGDEDERRAAGLNRQRLIDACLPLYLGGAPALASLLEVRGRDGMRRTGSEPLAWAVVRFLLSDPQLTPLLQLALQRASDAPPEREVWSRALKQAHAQEAAFERFLFDATLSELLANVREGATPVDRWESAAALRLLANLDLDPDADEAHRAALVAGGQKLLAEDPPSPRFLTRYVPELGALMQSRSRLEAMAKLKTRVRREFERRVKGYGHPAVVRARRDLGRALDRALAEARSGALGP